MVNEKLMNPVTHGPGKKRGAMQLYCLVDSANLMRKKLAQGADLSMGSMKILKDWMRWAASDARAAGVRASDWR